MNPHEPWSFPPKVRHLSLPFLMGSLWVIAVPSAGTQNHELHGKVLCGATPVRGAVVVLSASEVTEPRTAISDAEGSYEFSGLPGASFRLQASKPGFVAEAEKESIRTITLRTGEQSTNVLLSICKGAVITGTVFDRSSAGIPNVPVSVVPEEGVPDLTSVVTTTTDLEGRYRVFGLPAGSYWVVATPHYVGRQAVRPLSVEEVDNALRTFQSQAGTKPQQPTSLLIFAPAIHPGSRSAPIPIQVTRETEQPGIDVLVEPVAFGSVEGMIVGGSPGSMTTLVLNPTGPLLPESLRIGLDATFFNLPIVKPDGTFVLQRVQTGRHLLMALSAERTSRDSVVPESLMWAETQVSVGGDVRGVSLALQPALHFAGRLVFEGTDSATMRTAGVRLSLRAINARFSALAPAFLRALATSVQIGVDGAFDLPVIPGRYRFQVSYPDGSPITGWAMKAVTVGSRTLPGPDVVISNQDLRNAVATFAQVRR